MRVGLKYGFDSGMSLDYVYRNQAQGCGPIGRWIDKGYLNAIGWRGVRIRREHLIATVEERIETLKQRNEPVKYSTLLVERVIICSTSSASFLK